MRTLLATTAAWFAVAALGITGLELDLQEATR